MTRYDTLSAVRDHVWTELAAAADDPGHRFRNATVGTVQNGAPNLRTVVLRTADPEEQVLAFHSDRRAQKIEDIRAHDRVAWHWWTPETREQVRLGGRATVHLDDEVAERMWADQDPSSLAVHARHTPSGTPIDAPDDGLVAAVQDEPITRDDVAEGRAHFAVVRSTIDRIDWLHLHPEGHYRAQLRWLPDVKEWEGTWVVP